MGSRVFNVPQLGFDEYSSQGYLQARLTQCRRLRPRQGKQQKATTKQKLSQQASHCTVIRFFTVTVTHLSQTSCLLPPFLQHPNNKDKKHKSKSKIIFLQRAGNVTALSELLNYKFQP